MLLTIQFIPTRRLASSRYTMFEFTALFAALFSFATFCDGANISSDSNVGINQTKSCLWSCAARNNNFGQAMSAVINQSQLTTLQVELEKQEQPMCGKQKSGNSSKLVILSWIWIATQAHTEEENPRLLGSVASSMSHGRKMSVAVSCSFQESARTAEGNITTSSSSLNEQVARVLADEIMKLSTFVSKLGSLCYKTAHNNPYTCVDLMELKRSDVNRPRCEQEECGVLESIFAVAFATVFLFYSAAVFCLFSLDESITEEGVRLMDLEGPSPKGFRIFVARRFFSRNGTGSILRKMTTFLCLALILPLLVYLILLTASWYTNTEYPELNVLQLGLGGYISSRSRKLLFITCYFLRCLVFSFQSTDQFGKECFMCNTCAQSQDNHIHDSFPNAIKCHLLLQLELIKMICTVPILALKDFLQGCFSFVRDPLFRVRVRHLILKAFSYAGVWIIIVVFFICASPVVHLILCLVDCAEYSIVTVKSGVALFILTLVIEFIYKVVVTVGMFDIFQVITRFVYIAIVKSVSNLVFSPEEFLPYIACFVVIAFNLWKCYSSFSDDYQNLKLKIYQCCKAEQGQFAESGLERKRKLMYQDSEGALRIPEELYDIVCTKLMPVSQSFCKMLLKALSLLAYVLFVFNMILSHGKRSEIRPGFQAVATFFTGIMPKLAMLGAMFMGGKMGAVLREVALENKLRRIVLQYAKWEILPLASNPRETEI